MNSKNWLRGIFGQKQQVDIIDVLEQDSSDVLNIFNDTITNLSFINEEIEIEQEARALEIQALIKEQDRLSIIKEKNSKIVSKINSFFNE